MKALIQGTRICDLVDDDKTFEVHSDLKWVNVADDTTQQDTYVEGKVVKFVAPTLTYAENRISNYPQIGDQLDDLYHKGAFSDAMAAQIKKIKDKYPKGEG
tara:strand:- start:183 stop:485 length:303 start_codon:yes stop_codon:yes gene_type:complete